MTEAYLERRLRFWQKRMNLDHWTITIEFVEECPNPVALASVFLNDDYDSADVVIKEDQTERGKDHIDYLITHELGHILLRDFDWAARRAMKSLSRDSADMFDALLEHELESAVDKFSRIVTTLAKE